MSLLWETSSIDWHKSRIPWVCHCCGQPHRAGISYYMPDNRRKFCDPVCFDFWMEDVDEELKKEMPSPPAE